MCSITSSLNRGSRRELLLLDPVYRSWSTNAREGTYNGRKVGKSYATPLPVNVDGHAELCTHTIPRVEDVCAVVCSRA
ncbi:BQ5605_C021g09299 [Microbotryum silenes-dioicae]|uniref:BQ5605_C021g09299 protein n=1 Tax=Microbotryum silenes-dioicae TaxID=796604 RepID=A0A2X0MMT4_9BASI|nr:BQ5605_C021g09299 [Microbotryum silenes-dioicae]